MAWTLSKRLFYTAIFISGSSALVYQLIWVRLLGLVFGVSSFAVATVVAVFLLGLGLGSYFFGKWSERTENPLRIYMYVEVGIAVVSLVSYLVIDYLPVYRYLYESAYNSLDLYGTVRRPAAAVGRSAPAAGLLHRRHNAADHEIFPHASTTSAPASARSIISTPWGRSPVHCSPASYSCGIWGSSRP